MRAVRNLLVITLLVNVAAEPQTRPPEPIVAQSELTTRQVRIVLETLGLRRESSADRKIGPNTYGFDTWVKPDSKLKVFVLWRGQSAPTFSFEAIPSDPSKTVTTRHSTYEGWIPGVAQTDLTRDECTALMGHLGFESDGDGAWKKALPDGTTMRVTALPGSSRFYFRGIPRR